jgi:hypothetical protein
MTLLARGMYKLVLMLLEEVICMCWSGCERRMILLVRGMYKLVGLLLEEVICMC